MNLIYSEKNIKNISKFLFVISVIILPFMLMAIAFGIAGSAASYIYIFAIGYIFFIIFSLVSIFKYKFFPIVILSFLVALTGYSLENRYWGDHNESLCEDLRADPTCVEDECGFDCSNFRGAGGFFTAGSVCKDKDPKICIEKSKKELQNNTNTEGIMNVYSNIVDRIILSKNPEKEDFEGQLVAIYNCLEKEYGVDAERLAVGVLSQKKLSDSQLNKYYDYLSSKSRNVLRTKIVAGLPGGDSSISCDDIKY